MKILFKLVCMFMIAISSVVFAQTPNTNNIQATINSLEETIIRYQAKEIQESELGHAFEESLFKKGFSKGDFAYFDTENYSSDYKSFENRIITVSDFANEDEYSTYLLSLKPQVLKSNLNEYEKISLIDAIEFQIQFVSMMDRLDLRYPSDATARRKSWWDRWGKCAASTVGGGLTGGVVGCGAIGGIGAIVGTIVPGAGNAAGALVGCIGGGIVGAVGGALSGAALGC